MCFFTALCSKIYKHSRRRQTLNPQFTTFGIDKSQLLRNCPHLSLRLMFGLRSNEEKIKKIETFSNFLFLYLADGQVVHPKKVIGTPIGWLLTIVKSAFASLKRRAERLLIGKNLIFAGGVIFHTPILYEIPMVS